MSERNEAVLKFVKLFQRAFPGLSPTYRQVMDSVDIPSTSLVSYCVNRLSKQGVIEEVPTANHHGLVLRDAVLVTKEDAQVLGINWARLVAYKEAARQELRSARYGRSNN